MAGKEGHLKHSYGFRIHSSDSSFMSRAGSRVGVLYERWDLRPREAAGGRLLGDSSERGKLPKVSPPRSVAVEAACESLSPSPCTPPHPAPHGLPHARVPRAPIPVLQDPGWGCGGRKGPLHLHPLPCSKPVGTTGWRGLQRRC